MKKAIIKAFIVSALLLAVCFSLIACGKGALPLRKAGGSGEASRVKTEESL